jgi:PAS domain S-box-containing protein
MTEVDIERLSRAVAESPAEAIIYADQDGVIRFWNAGAERLFGFRAEEARGRSLDIIIPEKLRAAHWRGYRHVMQTGESGYQSGDLLAVPGVRKDGRRISLEFTVTPLRDATGRIEGIAAVMRDVTSRWEEMKALQARVQATERKSNLER